MLILGQRNDDSLAREFDWFGSSERLEISPASIWVPDEDETIRRRRVTAHRPPIAEQNAGDQWGLHEISPEVSVRDDDSFAKPSAVPEIIPHVSVRDEDSLPQPRALPEISPHVSIRDDDSFAKPCALPEINPQISILEESHASLSEATLSDVGELPLEHDIVQDTFVYPLPQFTPGVCGIDDSKVQPGEPSFVSVSLDGQNEKRFVQEYVELGPSRATILESSPEFESSRPTELESSLPPEVQSSRPTVLESNRPTELESSHPTVSPQVRVLDESQVLPGEASFATAISSEPFDSRSHSPLEEFLAKTNLDLRTLMLASLLFVSILGVSTLVILEATTGIFSSQHVASATSSRPSQGAESVVPQSEVLATTKQVVPVTVSKPSKQESQSMAPPRGYSKFPGEVTKPMSVEGSISDLSRKAHSNDVRAEKVDKKSAAKSASRETSSREGEKHAAAPKNLRANAKESGARKKVAESVSRHSTSSQKRAEVNKSNSKATAKKPVSASARDAAITKPKGGTRLPSASNGAQRPRTVTRPSGPGQ